MGRAHRLFGTLSAPSLFGQVVTICSGYGEDVLEGVNSRLTGDAGNDTLSGMDGSSVSGGYGHDTIYVNSGSEGAGGAGDDRLIGRAGMAR